MAGYNERKLEILELVEAGFNTSTEIVEACGISHSCAASHLLRYWKMGLLSRSTAELFNEKIYDISVRGLERLDYLRDTVLERMETDEMDDFLSKIKRCKIIRQSGRENIYVVVDEKQN